MKGKDERYVHWGGLDIPYRTAFWGLTAFSLIIINLLLWWWNHVRRQ